MGQINWLASFTIPTWKLWKDGLKKRVELMSTLYFLKDTNAQKHLDLKGGLGRTRLATALQTL